MSTPQYPKRPGSPLSHQSLPPAKAPRLTPSQLQINYLVRQKQETLPLVTEEERMPRILQLIGEYDGVLQRHESMAGNLGAYPLGPILLKRFERLFDGPPRVLKSHAKDPNVTWLDVVEFAQNRPEQFNLEKQRNGVRVCQFYHKQCRVEISEEDHVLIASGMPQKLIPPQPILEDEEKELGVMEMLERNLGKVFQMADQVSARARQLNHKLKNRRAAILARREAEGDPRRLVFASAGSPMSPVGDLNASRLMRSIEQSQSPPLGFTAVNVRPANANDLEVHTQPRTAPPPYLEQPAHSENSHRRSNSIRTDNLGKFLTESERQAGMTEDSVRRSSLPPLNRDAFRQTAQTRMRPEPPSAGIGPTGTSDTGSPSVAIPGTPASLLPQVKSNPLPKDDGGPYKAEMVSRMESMQRGDRIIPPCDRCRRLQMDCMKNLTACQGCTKKHAKCAWKDVTVDELKGNATTISKANLAKVTPNTGPSESATRDWDQILKETGGNEAARPPDRSKHDSDTIEVTSSANQQQDVKSSSPMRQHQAPQTSPKLDLRPPPLEQQIRDATNGKFPDQGQYVAPHHNFQASSQHHRVRTRDQEIDRDEGDRLQELARKVYRSASQSVRPPS